MRGWEPSLDFVLFAGRRSFIDAGPDTQAEWGLLRQKADITVKTYDYLLDALRDDRTT